MMARVPIDPLPEQSGPASQADDATGFVERNREVIRIGTLVSGETWKDHRRLATDPLDNLGMSPIVAMPSTLPALSNPPERTNHRCWDCQEL